MLYIQGIDQISVVDGSLTLPAVSFSADPDNGLYRIGANDWGLAAGGVLALEMTATAVKIGSGLTLTIQGAGYVEMSGRYIQGISSLSGRDDGDMSLYVNKTDAAATARSLSVLVLDTTGDAWRTLIKVTGGAGVTDATALLAFHGANPVAQAAHITDASDLATAITAINAALVVLENKGLTAVA